LKELVPDHLQRLPECPFVGSDTYSQTYRSGPSIPYPLPKVPSGGKLEYWFACGGANHDFLERDPDYPAYTNLTGILDDPPQQ
jgi:hypothetical protein